MRHPHSMRWFVLSFIPLVLVSCGSFEGRSLHDASVKLEQVSTLEQARSVFGELPPLAALEGPLNAREKQDSEEFRSASVRVMKTFGGDPEVSLAYHRFISLQTDLAHRISSALP